MRAARGERGVSDDELTSELGCVTPVIVVPGAWSEKQLAFQARSIATMQTNNAAFNCNSAKVIVTWAGWRQRRRFLEHLENALATTPTRTAYYPGSDRSYETFLDAHPEARQFGSGDDGHLPWAFAKNVSSSRDDEPAFADEIWGPVSVETAIEAEERAEFLPRAVAFANDRLWGTLSCGLIVDGKTARALDVELDRAIADLRYGSVAINLWPGVSYGLGSTTWGAFPGHTLDDVGSGIGVVHNTRLFDRPQKSVIRGPFVIRPKPAWFAGHKQAHTVGRLLTRFEANPKLSKLPAITRAAFGG